MKIWNQEHESIQYLLFSNSNNNKNIILKLKLIEQWNLNDSFCAASGAKSENQFCMKVTQQWNNYLWTFFHTLTETKIVICYLFIYLFFFYQLTIRKLLKKSFLLQKQKLIAENERNKWKSSYESLKVEHEMAEQQLRVRNSLVWFVTLSHWNSSKIFSTADTKEVLKNRQLVRLEEDYGVLLENPE